jgi:hypothetical protein
MTLDHVNNFLDCVRTRKLPNGDVLIGHRSAQASHLGNIAYVEKRRIDFDPLREEIRFAARRFKGHDERPADLRDGAYAALPHDQLQLGAQKIDHFLNARLSESRQAPAIGTADRNAARPERQSLEDVRASAEAAIYKNSDFAAGAGYNFGQTLDGASSGLFRASAVVGDDDTVDPVLAAQLNPLAFECP